LGNRLRGKKGKYLSKKKAGRSGKGVARRGRPTKKAKDRGGLHLQSVIRKNNYKKKKKKKKKKKIAKTKEKKIEVRRKEKSPNRKKAPPIPRC